MLALTIAEGNGVSFAAAETNNTLNPLKISISLTLIRIRGKLRLLNLITASIKNIALNTSDIRLADNKTMVILRNLERQRLLLARSPGLGVVDAQRSGENVFDERDAEAGAYFERVGDGEAGSDADGGLGTVETADDGGHGDIPVEEFFFG